MRDPDSDVSLMSFKGLISLNKLPRHAPSISAVK